MTDKELKKLSRMELLQLLVDQSKELESTKQELLETHRQVTELTEKLNSKELKKEQAGSIAEAALQLNGVFEAAQAAADEYLAHIKEQQEQQQTLTDAALKDAKAEAQRIITDTKENAKKITREADAQVANAQRTCEETTQKAQAEVKKYWEDISSKLEAFYEEHAGLREMLAFMNNPVAPVK